MSNRTKPLLSVGVNMKDLNKKQQKIAAKLIIGCVAFYGEFGLDEAKTTDNDITNISKEIEILSYKLIGKHETFPSTSEIIQYVRDNF